MEKNGNKDKKEVRIRIRSERYEVEESLFSGELGDELSVQSFDAENAPEIIEINTVGYYRVKDGHIEISYEETEATGMEGSVSSISYMRSQEGIVTMTRSGAVSTVLTFEAGKRYQCVYQTPFMPFQICVRTLKVNNLLSTLGTLELDYVIEIRGAKAERNKFSMQLLN